MTDIKRNDTEIVRVSKREFKGHEFLDLRIYYQDDEGDYKPTKKGITINPKLVDELIDALNKEKDSAPVKE
ncbi:MULTISPECIES: transcriptional coactivator p15/PC4 family protein [unclassified Mesotoga]|uniref:Transcriptional Coactivator p15 (PC4) n=2 Tax=Mesotoga TaxID=1184396 RepID=A0A101GYX0_9BACT|nr:MULTISPECIES: transcriptional coactivator p15/PC4 family protein [unclassified Mesotoga]KUK67007.1 MAG: Transcriptional Coactivator p15 (PC4) [Mesotoga infera]NLT44095.1 transcriptional coactivator p15 [Thermotogaceae bacterium]PZC52293.1 transcriptional coactivator p15 [Mesotoga sp. TolDC]RLL85571.1 transcriptional coactivator p15 [Mesotoga sp. BH458_6_3_2_1]